MTTYTDTTTKFLDEKKSLKGMDKELAQALIQTLGGEQSFLDSLIDAEKTSLLHQEKVFGEDSMPAVLRFYEQNHQLLLNFASAQICKTDKESSLLLYVKSLCLSNPHITLNYIAKSLYNPTFTITDASTEVMRRDFDATKQIATVLYYEALIHLTECYCEFLSGVKYKYDKGFLFSLEYDREMLANQRLAMAVIQRFSGGYQGFKDQHDLLANIKMNDKVSGFNDSTDMVDFFEKNKGDIVPLIKKIGGKDKFSGIIGSMQHHLEGENFTLEDIGRGLFEPVFNNNYTNLKTDIARAAVNLSIKAIARDYMLYQSKLA